jgi:hypothetical protein
MVSVKADNRDTEVRQGLDFMAFVFLLLKVDLIHIHWGAPPTWRLGLGAVQAEMAIIGASISL